MGLILQEELEFSGSGRKLSTATIFYDKTLILKLHDQQLNQGSRGQLWPIGKGMCFIRTKPSHTHRQRLAISSASFIGSFLCIYLLVPTWHQLITIWFYSWRTGLKLTSKKACQNGLSQFFANRDEVFSERDMMVLPSKWQLVTEHNGV